MLSIFLIQSLKQGFKWTVGDIPSGLSGGGLQFWLDSLRQSDILGYIFEETAKEVISRAALRANNFCLQFDFLRCNSFLLVQ